MTSLIFLSIPLILVALVGLVVVIARHSPEQKDDPVTKFASEMGALAPPGVPVQRHDPVRPAGYPNQPLLDPTKPMDVLLAQDAERRLDQHPADS